MASPETSQAPPSLGSPRQEYLRGLPLPSPWNLPDPGSEPGSPGCAGGFFYDRATREQVVKMINLLFVDMLQVHKKRGAGGSSSGPPSWGPGSGQLARKPPGRGAGWSTGVLVASSSPGAQTTWAARAAAPSRGVTPPSDLVDTTRAPGAWRQQAPHQRG